MTTNADATVLLSIDELNYLLAKQPKASDRANSVGLNFNALLLSLSSEAEGVVQRSLLARGYLTMSENADVEIEQFLAKVLQVVTNPIQRLDIRIENLYTQAVDYTCTLLSPDLTVSYTVLPNGGQDLRVFRSLPSFAGDLAALLPDRANEQNRLNDQVVRQEFDAAVERLAVGIENASSGNTTVLTMALQIAKRSEFLVSVTRWIGGTDILPNEAPQSQQISIFWDDTTMVVIEDPLPDDPNGPLYTHSVTTTELSGLLTAWLAPLAAHTSLA